MMAIWACEEKAKVRGTTNQYSSCKCRKPENYVIALLGDIGNQENSVNQNDGQLPHLLENIQQIRDRYEIEVGKQDL